MKDNTPKSKYFKIEEFACKDGTQVPEEYYDNVQELMDNLDVLREHLGYPIVINSGYRTPEYNKSVGGAKKSQHLTASAADIRLNVTPSVVQKAIKKLMKDGDMKKGGLGIYSTFTHYDIGKSRTW